MNSSITKKLKNEKGIQKALDSIVYINSDDHAFYMHKLLYSGNMSEYDIATKLFFKNTKYTDTDEHLGEGSYGSVFTVIDTKNNIYAVKMTEITDEISMIDEIRLNVLFSDNDVGPLVYETYIIDVNGEKFGFIIMEKLEKTLADYLVDGGIISDGKSRFKKKMDEMKTLFKKTLELGFSCFDFKAGNIMINSKGNVKLIDFGEFCCDYDKSNMDMNTLLDIQIINVAFTTKEFYKHNIFIDDIKKILSSEKRFNKIVQLFTRKGSYFCNISDKYGDRDDTLISKMIRTTNHYITNSLIEKFLLYKDDKIFSGKKNKYLNNSFANAKGMIISNNSKTVWTTRIIVALNFIVNNNINSYSELLPKKYVDKYLLNKKSKTFKLLKKKNKRSQRKKRRTNNKKNIRNQTKNNYNKKNKRHKRR